MKYVALIKSGAGNKQSYSYISNHANAYFSFTDDCKFDSYAEAMDIVKLKWPHSYAEGWITIIPESDLVAYIL
jgi:hypothetical protein